MRARCGQRFIAFVSHLHDQREAHNADKTLNITQGPPSVLRRQDTTLLYNRLICTAIDGDTLQCRSDRVTIYNLG